MNQIPCETCQYYTTFSDGFVSCYAPEKIEFYWPENIDEMLKFCPRGFRARKISDKSFHFYRDYQSVEKI